MKGLLTVALFALALPFAARADEAALARGHLAASDGEWMDALGWYTIAAESGDVRAQETVAFMYLHGEAHFPGITHSIAAAKAWYYRAEAQGSVVARRMLASLEREPREASADAFATVDHAPVR